MSTVGRTREFTGWHMVAIMAAFFSVIITVNLTMAFFARSSWSGFVVENTYVASQQFNRKAAEGRTQAELGWKPNLTIAEDMIYYRLVDSSGHVMAAKQATVSFRRPTSASEDQEVVLLRQPDGSFSAPVKLRDGLWIAEIHSEVDLGHTYRDVRRLTLSAGAIQ